VTLDVTFFNFFCQKQFLQKSQKRPSNVAQQKTYQAHVSSRFLEVTTTSFFFAAPVAKGGRTKPKRCDSGLERSSRSDNWDLSPGCRRHLRWFVLVCVLICVMCVLIHVCPYMCHVPLDLSAAPAVAAIFAGVCLDVSECVCVCVCVCV